MLYVFCYLDFKIYPDVKKLLRGHWLILSYLGLKFPELKPRKANFLLYWYSKVIGLTNYELIISNYQLKVHEFFWLCNDVLILPKLSH